MSILRVNKVIVLALFVGVIHLILMLPIIADASDEYLASLLVLIFCLVIGSSCIPVVIFSGRVFLVTLFGLIYYVYLLIIPAIAQISTEFFYWKSLSSYSEAHILTASLICLAGIIGLAFGFRMQTKKNARNIIVKIQPLTCNKSQIIGILSLALAAISLFYILMFFDLDTLLSTRYTLSRVYIGSDTHMMAGLMLDLPRAATGACLILTTMSFRNCPKRCAIFFIAVLLINAVVNFPGSTARFILGGILISSLLVYIRNWDAKKMIGLWISMVFALFFLFPAWGTFNRSSSFIFDLELISPYRYLLSGDLDGFQSITNVVAMTEVTGHAFGMGLLSAVLFFVPRSIWPGKAEPTGVVAAEYNGYEFTNISAPIFSEYYHDFGIIGFFIMCVITGYFVARMEMRNPLFSAVMAGFVIIIMRGSLLAISRTPMTVAIIFLGLMFLSDFITRSKWKQF